MFSVLTNGLSEHTAHQHFGRPLVRAALLSFFAFLLGLISFSQWHLVCVDNHDCSLGGICVALKDRGGKCSVATAAGVRCGDLGDFDLERPSMDGG